MSDNKPVIQTRDKKDALEAIREYMLDTRGRVELTDKQEDQYIRLRAAWTLLVNFHSREQASKVLEKDFNISDRQAKRDISDALWLYGDTTKTDKEGQRLIACEMALKAFQLSAKAGDHNAMNQAVKNFIKVNGLDKEDPDRPDFAKLQGNIYVQALDTESQRALTRMLKKPGSLDFSKMQVEDAEHEDITK